MRIIALQADRGGCGRYRIENPMLALMERGHEVSIQLTAPRMQLCSAQFASCEVVVIERYVDPAFIDLLDSIPTQWTPAGVLKRPKVVYETDDLNWALTPDRPHSEVFTSEMRAGIRECIRRSDGVLVSTDNIAEEVCNLRGSGDFIGVIPNAIDFTLRDWSKPAPRHELLRDKIVIGWLGGDRPLTDFQSVHWSLREVLVDNPKCILAIAGSPDQTRKILSYLRIPPGRAVIFPPVPFDEYPQLVSQFDIGLAPIADTRFNRCKSDLKLLEYGAWGMPYVASNVAPYSRYHRGTSGTGGYLASKPLEWKLALERLTLDEGDRHTKGQAASEYVRRERSLEKSADLWERALREVISE